MNNEWQGEIVEWNKTPLLIHLKHNGILVETKASKIDTIKALPRHIFELPRNIRVIENDTM